MSPAREGGRLLLLAAAAAWPFFVHDPAAHQVGVEVLVYVLIGLSFVVTLGWLRTVTLLQPAAAAAGGLMMGELLHIGQALPVGILAAALAGATVGVVTVAPVLRQPRRYLPVWSFAVALLAWGVLVPRVLSVPFARPVPLGIDLAGDRTLYVAGLLVAGAAYLGIAAVRRLDLGRRLITVGAAPGLAARSGVGVAATWVEGGILAGMLSGLGGALFAVLVQSSPGPEQWSPAVGIALLAIPLVGGAVVPEGAVIGAAVYAVAPRLWPGTGDPVMVGALLAVLAAVLIPGGLLGVLMPGRRDRAAHAGAGRLQSGPAQPGSPETVP